MTFSVEYVSLSFFSYIIVYTSSRLSFSEYLVHCSPISLNEIAGLGPGNSECTERQGTL